MDFVCLGLVDANGAKVVSGRPMIECHDTDPIVPDERVDLKNRTLGTFGLVTNTARGEVAAIDMDEARLVDLDTGNPGYNQVPAGGLPEAIAPPRTAAGRSPPTVAPATSRPRSRAHAGHALRHRGALDRHGAGGADRARAGREGDLRVSPQEIAFLPLTKEQVVKGAPACQAATGDAGPSVRALVTFPACDLWRCSICPRATS
jgi:hypothetical protein